MKRQAVIPWRHGASHSGDNFVEAQDAHALSRRLVSPVREAVVCRFWLEKALLLVDALQIYALLWQLSQPWPWPAPWLRYSRWTNAFNLDVFSFGATGAAMGATSQSFSLWGEMRHYWGYALVFASTPYVVVGIALVLLRKWEAEGRTDFVARRFVCENVVLQLLQVLYMPVVVAVMRLVNCTADGRVAVDPSIFPQCWSLTHSLSVGIITCGLGGVFVIGLPVLLYRRINMGVFTHESDEHERFLQARELEYILSTSNAYLELCMPQYASYRRCGVQSAVEACMVKLSLVMVFSLLRSQADITSSQGIQGTLFFLILLITASRTTVSLRYRIESSNMLHKLTSWLLAANGFIGLLCANKVRSAITVSTSITSILSVINISVLVTIGISLGASIKQWTRRHVLHTEEQNELSAVYSCWPTHRLMRAIIHFPVEVPKWISLVQRCKSLTLSAALVSSTMKPYKELCEMRIQLEDAYNEARDHQHLLSAQLHQELLYVSGLYVDAFAATPFRSLSLPEDHDAVFHDLARRLDQREYELYMFPTHRRRILSKLLAARSWSSSSPVNMGSTADQQRAHHDDAPEDKPVQDLIRLSDESRAIEHDSIGSSSRLYR